MLRALVVTVTASLFVAASADPLAPYVFVAGVEGTGHHWFSSFFGKCKKAGECESSEVGVFEWQWVLAQIKEKPDAARFAVAALPATVLCDHYDQEDLTDATRGGLARLGAYLEIDAPTFAAATNKGHKPKKKKEPPHPERDALVAALKEAQEGAAAACRARGAASSEAKLDT
ncbi:hypothetical protein JL722_526 [Aureococcus anophagefferens]|nr:hypothetical protein JL722_526 [Aureococcus anophagefferens]